MQLPSTKSVNKKGYTLIEILIVMAIMSVLFTIGFLSFLDYSRQQALFSIVRSIKSDLRLTEDSANSSLKPAGCSNMVVDGYRFRRINNTTYTLEASCSDNAGNHFIAIKQPVNTTLPAGFTMSAPNPNPIVFKSLSQGTNIIAGRSASIIITQTSTSKTVTITIGENGSIQ